MDEMDDELIQEQRVLEAQMPGLQRVASEESMTSSGPSSIGDDSSMSSPPRQRRRIQMRTPERPIRGVGTPDVSPQRGTLGAYTPRNMRRLAYETNPFYEQSSAPVGSAERALEDMMGEDSSSVGTGSSSSQSVDLFGANQIRGRTRDPEPLPLTRFSETREGNALFRRRSRDNLFEIPEMEEELQGPVQPGALFADTLSTPDRKKNDGIKSKSKRSKSKRGKVTRKTKRKTKKSKRRKSKKRKTIKKKKKTRR